MISGMNKKNISMKMHIGVRRIEFERGASRSPAMNPIRGARTSVAPTAKAGLVDDAFGPGSLAPRPYGEAFARFGKDRRA